MLSKIAILFSLSFSLSQSILFPPPLSLNFISDLPSLLLSQRRPLLLHKADQDGKGLHTCPSSISWGLWTRGNVFCVDQTLFKLSHIYNPVTLGK